MKLKFEFYRVLDTAWPVLPLLASIIFGYLIKTPILHPQILRMQDKLNVFLYFFWFIDVIFLSIANQTYKKHYKTMKKNTDSPNSPSFGHLGRDRNWWRCITLVLCPLDWLQMTNIRVAQIMHLCCREYTCETWEACSTNMLFASFCIVHKETKPMSSCRLNMCMYTHMKNCFLYPKDNG